MRTVLEPLVDPDAVLCSDGSAIYQSFSKQTHITHRPVNLSAGIRVVNQVLAQLPRMAAMLGAFRQDPYSFSVPDPVHGGKLTLNADIT